MPRTPTPIPYKAILQLRYKPELGFFQLILPAAQKLTEYRDWETDRLRVTLRDYEKHCSAAITHEAFSYEQDSGDPDIENERVQHLLTVVPDVLQIHSMIRFGYRRWFLVPTTMPFDSLVSVLGIKLLSHEESLRRILPVQLTDLMYRVDSSDDGYRYHITIGPVRKQEIPKWLPYNRENHLNPTTAGSEFRKILDAYPEVAVIMDFDIYRQGEEMPASEAAPFVDEARKRLNAMANDLSEYVFGA